jgi:D-lactate dehydrogenase
MVTRQRAVNAWTGNNFGTLANASRLGLAVWPRRIRRPRRQIPGRISGGAWKKNMPRAGKSPAAHRTQGDPVVYFPTCGGRIFGPTPGEAQLGDVIIELLTRAGYAPRLPKASTTCAAARCWPARAWRKKPKPCPTRSKRR